MAEMTVVFADLTGSTGIFELLGNSKATHAITRITHWIGKVCEAHNGYVVKYLGDGVLVIFLQSPDAINAVTELQRVHQVRIKKWPDPLKMQLQIGMARGEVVRQNGDCYGDAVNVASRLSDLCEPEQILVTDTVIKQLPKDNLVRSRSMGAMAIRGRIEPCIVHRIEWQSEVLSEVFTMPANLDVLPIRQQFVNSISIELSWLDITKKFIAINLPLLIGRDASTQFIIQDQRVSRKHARIEWRSGKFYLEDISSYGTWVRFPDSSTIMALRRQECVLLSDGEISLGAPFEDFAAPTIYFRFNAK